MCHITAVVKINDMPQNQPDWIISLSVCYLEHEADLAVDVKRLSEGKKLPSAKLVPTSIEYYPVWYLEHGGAELSTTIGTLLFGSLCETEPCPRISPQTNVFAAGGVGHA